MLNPVNRVNPVKKKFFMKSIFVIMFLLLSVEMLWTQTLERRDKNNRDYKYFICDILEGDSGRAIEISQEEIKKNSGNADAWFALSLVYAQDNKIDSSLLCFKTAIDSGLPVERFLAGPRKLLEPLTSSKQFIDYFKQNPVELLHGPMLGSVTHNSARFWVRTLSEVKYKVKVYSAESAVVIESNTVQTMKENDFTAIVEVGGLKLDTQYGYEVILDDKPINIVPQPTFKTYPQGKAKKKFQIVFGGGSNFNPKYEHIWDTIQSYKPLVFLWLGDNTYYNIADVPEHQRYCFYRRYARPEFRRMTATIPTYAIWDDHDFGGNDCVGGPQIDKPAWKKDVVLKIFKENYNNPYYGGGETAPGCWHDFSIGDVDFFMLDGRYYRTDPRSKEPLYTDSTAEYPSMLGPVQKQWLFNKLKNSKATFKIIASPVPWAASAKKSTQWSANLGKMFGALDTWQGFPDEREEIFSFIEKNKIEGVFLISADRHRSDAWKIERENGYDFYEAMSSHLTKDSSHPFQDKAIFSILGKPAFGLLTFDFSKDDPEIIYQVVKIDNKVAAELVVKRSQLSF